MNHRPIEPPEKIESTRYKPYRYYDLVMAAFVTVLLTSNLIGAAKVVTVWKVTFGAGVLFFPLSYIFGDILTEVYGYARSRKVVWAGFAATGLCLLHGLVRRQSASRSGWEGQAAIQSVFGTTYRLALASFIASFCGEFSNSYVLGQDETFHPRQVSLDADHRLNDYR